MCSRENKRRHAEEFVGWVSKDGNLKVTGIIGKNKQGNKLYSVTCKICSPDLELFPLGYFISTRGNLEIGKKPCGCSKRPKWTQDQFMILINRISKKENFVVIGIVGKYNGAYTKVDCECNIDGHKWTPNINNIINNKQGCPECGNNRKKISTSDALERCKEVCDQEGYEPIGFIDGYKNTRSYFWYKCPEHGLHRTRYDGFVNSGNKCPSCAETGYTPNKPGSFYVVKWSKDAHSFIKFGITNRKVKTRIRQQASKTKYNYEILFQQTWEDGKIADNIEEAIKNSKSFSINVIDKEYFNDGFTETVEINSINSLLDCVHSYLRKIVLDEVIEYTKPEETA